MYFQINNDLIRLTINPYPKIEIFGDDFSYLVEFREYIPGEERSYLLRSFECSRHPRSLWANTCNIPITFRFEFQINVYKFILNEGIKLIFSHRYNDSGKLVLFNLKSNDYETCKLWVERIKKYQSLHLCNPVINSEFEDLNRTFPAYYQTHGIEYYKTYDLGKFPKQSTDFPTLDQRKHGLIYWGNWKTFWSYEHPRNWNHLTPQEIADDILGL